MKIKSTDRIIHWLIIIAIPFLITTAMVRILMAWDTPSYPEFAYPRIASDRFGFTDAERLDLANATMAYLRRSEPADEVIYLLEELRLPNSDKPLYTVTEVGHMLDVKIVADAFSRVMWIMGIIVVGGSAFLMIRPLTRPLGALALKRGGMYTAVIVIAVIILIGVAWNFIFALFHNILFPPGTWTFAYSDSLIRLFPEQFWFMFGLLWTVGILLDGVILGIIGHFLHKKWS